MCRYNHEPGKCGASKHKREQYVIQKHVGFTAAQYDFLCKIALNNKHMTINKLIRVAVLRQLGWTGKV